MNGSNAPYLKEREISRWSSSESYMAAKNSSASGPLNYCDYKYYHFFNVFERVNNKPPCKCTTQFERVKRHNTNWV